MGRRKQYASAAEKQRAYRARLAAEMMLVSRERWAAFEARLARVAAAVEAARLAGCPVAREITDTVNADTAMLESLAACFEARSQQLVSGLPKQGGALQPAKPVGKCGAGQSGAGRRAKG